MEPVEGRSRLADGVEVRASPIEGSGLFAARPFEEGEVVLVLGGRVVDDAGFAALAAQGPVSGFAMAEGRHVVQEPDDPARFGNHSCDPTCWLVGGLTVVARRAVAPGEELTTDYATLTGDPAWRMACRCGAATCRGAVTGRDLEQAALRTRYAGHVMPFLEARGGRPGGGRATGR